VFAVGLMLLGLVGCGPEPLPVAIGEHAAIPLSRVDQTVGVQLPETNRQDPLPARVSPLDNITETRRGKTWVEYRVAMPFRQVYLGHSASKQPRGLSLKTEYGHGFVYGHRDQAWTWRVDMYNLMIRLPPGVKPDVGKLTLRYEAAYAIEKQRNKQWSDRSERDFVFRTVEINDETVRGVYVPAPGAVSWKVTIPAHAHLRSRVHLLTPEVRIPLRSKGAKAEAVVLSEAGEVLAEGSCVLGVGKFCDLDLNLVKLDSQTVTVTLRSDPQGDTNLDYVFFEDPVIASVLEKPKQVVMVFVDTLRPDRLGAYGAERKTPAMDGFAERGVVFDAARSVSPWTLPAARAVLTGRQPEEWDEAATLAGTLADRGWATTAYVTNAFLSRPFGMGKDWGTYRYIFLNPAPKQVKAGRKLLSRHADRNQLLLVHFMDSHLPYKEPAPYLTMYAGERPKGLPKRFGLFDMDDFEKRADGREYLNNRYDQTVRYIDDALADLFDSLDEDAIVILYSDHGEEFWEHGGIEHGHAVWDELLRVPLIIRAPGLKPGRVAAPVSIMDIAPTLYELLEIEPPADLDGHSMLALARGEADAEAAFRSRPQVFGRTLRARDAWGMVQDQVKTVATAGTVKRYDLAADPGEVHPTELSPAQLAAARSSLTEGLGRAFMPVLRLRGPAQDKVWKLHDGEVRIEVEGGVRASWLGTNAPKRPPTVSGDQVVVKGAGYLPNELYVLPEAKLGELKRVVVTLKQGGQEYTAVWPDEAVGDAWLRLGPPGAQAELGVELAPLPAEVEVPTTSEEMEDELKILGYLDE